MNVPVDMVCHRTLSVLFATHQMVAKLIIWPWVDGNRRTDRRKRRFGKIVASVWLDVAWDFVDADSRRAQATR